MISLRSSCINCYFWSNFCDEANLQKTYHNGSFTLHERPCSYWPFGRSVRPSRYLRSLSSCKGKEVAFICGSDEHGVAISIKAKKEGKTPQQIIDKYDQIIRKSFQILGYPLIIIHEHLRPFTIKQPLNFLVFYPIRTFST